MLCFLTDVGNSAARTSTLSSGTDCFERGCTSLEQAGADVHFNFSLVLFFITTLFAAELCLAAAVNAYDEVLLLFSFPSFLYNLYPSVMTFHL